MKKLLIVIYLVTITFLGNNCIYGVSNIKRNDINSVKSVVSSNSSSSAAQKTEEMKEYFDGLLGVENIKNVDLKGFLLNPLELLWLFFKAIIIVIAINVASHVICKCFFSYSDIFKRRVKARRLNKVLRDIYD